MIAVMMVRVRPIRRAETEARSDPALKMVITEDAEKYAKQADQMNADKCWA